MILIGYWKSWDNTIRKAYYWWKYYYYFLIYGQILLILYYFQAIFSVILLKKSWAYQTRPPGVTMTCFHGIFWLTFIGYRWLVLPSVSWLCPYTIKEINYYNKAKTKDQQTNGIVNSIILSVTMSSDFPCHKIEDWPHP